jgi:hypothetical protein
MKAQKIKAPKREAGGRGHVADRYAASHARYVETSVYIPQSESNDNAGFFRVSRNMAASVALTLDAHKALDSGSFF